MALFDFFKKKKDKAEYIVNSAIEDKDDGIQIPNTKDIKDYNLFREAATKFNLKLGDHIPKKALDECGKKLGMLEKNVLVFGSQNEAAILFDYCFFNFRINKVNVIERYMMLSPPDVNSIDYSVLQSKLNGHYSVFSIQEVVKNKGVVVRDIFYGKELFLIDIALSSSAKEKVAFAGYVVPFKQFYVSTGTLLILQDINSRDQVLSIIEKFLDKKDENGRLSANREASFSGQIIRTLLKSYDWEHSRYEEP